MIQSNIFCLSAAFKAGLGGGGICDGMASTALAFILSHEPTMVQSTVKFKPPAGLPPVWHPAVAQLVCNTFFTAVNNGPAGAWPTVALPVLIQPSTSLAAVL